MHELTISSGTFSPLGATPNGKGVNFALFSTKEEVLLSLFEPGSVEPWKELPLERTENIWHLYVENLPQRFSYAFRINNCFVLDPYAKKLNTSHQWGEKKKLVLAEIPSCDEFDWEGDTSPNISFDELVIYEMHVRGFTQDLSSNVKHRGSFLGLIEKIPHLKKLGITAVELLPIFEFDETLHPAENLFNYWGYSTLNFFCPMARYSNKATIYEFREMVKALHKAGIEVILDVVFNHVGDRNSLFQIAPSTYFILDEQGNHTNYSGCGNTIQCNNPFVVEWILAILHYWVKEMHVDGFRFDLASIFYRGRHGEVLETSPIIDAINQDPILSKVKLIAEPWDCGGLYQVGAFSDSWAEWNGHYRDAVRRFLKGSDGQASAFASALSGSQDLFSKKNDLYKSINYITAHDGFTLRDLVSYNQKHNEENQENNRDGNDCNDSWNCGQEGETDDPEMIHLRNRQMRNFLTALCLSIGTPMILMGDEYGHTRHGNNNSYCQDNEANHFLWYELKKNKEWTQFFNEMLHFRKTTFPKKSKIIWHTPDWSSKSRFVAYTIGNLFIAFNAHYESVSIQLPSDDGKTWKRVLDTYQLHFDKTQEEIKKEYHLRPHSALILLAE